MQGGNYQVDKEPLLNIPLVQPTINNQESIIDLVNNILQEKSKNTDADITELENAIDKIVYQLYGLTEEEIAVIEGNNISPEPEKDAAEVKPKKPRNVITTKRKDEEFLD